jgi:hypothetical protein
MLETLFALAIVATLLVLLGLPAWVGFSQLVMGALLCLGVGLGFGGLAGVIYHVLLFKLLRERGLPATRWWVNPRALHEHLPEDMQKRLNILFTIGAIGCGLCFLGCALFFSASLLN